MRVVGTAQARIRLVEVEAAHVRRQAADIGLGQYQGRCAVFEQVGDTAGRIGRVHGHIGGPGLEYGQQGDDTVQRAIQAQGDALTLAYALCDQSMGQRVRASVELGVGQGQSALAHRCGIGHRGSLGLDQAMNGLALGVRLRGPVEAAQHLLARPVVQYGQALNADLRLVLQRPNQLRHGHCHPPGNPRRADVDQRQHVEGKAISQVVDAEGERVVAALFCPQQLHALPQPIICVGCRVGAVAVIEQCAEQWRTGGHAAAALGQCQ